MSDSFSMSELEVDFNAFDKLANILYGEGKPVWAEMEAFIEAVRPGLVGQEKWHFVDRLRACGWFSNSWIEGGIFQLNETGIRCQERKEAYRDYFKNIQKERADKTKKEKWANLFRRYVKGNLNLGQLVVGIVGLSLAAISISVAREALKKQQIEAVKREEVEVMKKKLFELEQALLQLQELQDLQQQPIDKIVK